MKKFLTLLLAVCMLASACAALADDAAAAPTYTYHTYSSALGNNWNPHTWETSADDSINSYISSPFCTMQVQDSENGIYQWVFEMAESIEDVTAEHQDDLTKYGVTLQEGKTAETTDAGFVYEIKLNPNAKWENGEPIRRRVRCGRRQQVLQCRFSRLRAHRSRLR